MSTIEVKQMMFEGEGKTEIFSFRPENVEKEKRGNLFFIGKIAKPLSERDAQYYLLHSLAAILKKEYYAFPSPHPVKAFESALKKANAFLSSGEHSSRQALEIRTSLRRNLVSRSAPLNGASLEMGVLVLTGGQVSFSLVGNLEILLLRDGRIFRLHKPKTLPLYASQLFHHVTKGKVKNQDRIILATPGFTKWFQTPAFASRLLKRPWERVRDYLRQERLAIKDGESLAMLQLSIDGSAQSQVFEKNAADSGIKKELPKPNIPREAAQLSLPIIHHSSSSSSSLFAFLKEVSKRNWPPRFPQTLIPFFRIDKFVSHKLEVKKKAAFIGLGIIIIIGLFGMLNWQSSLKVGGEKNETKTTSPPDALFQFTGIPGPSHAAFLGSSVFFVSQRQLYEFNLTTKTIEPLLSFKDEPKALTASETTLYLITKGERGFELTFFDPLERGIKKEPISWPLATENIKEAREYAQNLYIFEDTQGQIVKYPLQNLAGKSLWIEPETKKEMTRPLSFAVDGSIYLLQTPTAISELRLGKRVKKIPLASLVKADRIITSPSLHHLYLIDQTEGQIIAIAKESGNIVKTFRDERFKGTKDIRIDEVYDQIALVNAQAIYLFTQELP
ncbi:MAG: hypothetical protein HY001_03595 [Candidatus Portnoybacteria bacterium]|nr:hypothetical protein [Candidatus Portnoybacteria bacterium]